MHTYASLLCLTTFHLVLDNTMGAFARPIWFIWHQLVNFKQGQPRCLSDSSEFSGSSLQTCLWNSTRKSWQSWPHSPEQNLIKRDCWCLRRKRNRKSCSRKLRVSLTHLLRSPPQTSRHNISNILTTEFQIFVWTYSTI